MALKDIQYLWFLATRSQFRKSIGKRVDTLTLITKDIHKIKTADPKTTEIPQKTRVFNCLADKHTTFSEQEFVNEHKSWLEEYASLEAQIDLTKKKRQKKDRFQGPSGTLTAKVLKPFKRFFFGFYRAQLKIGNVFRKTKREPEMWFHQVKLRSLFQLKFRNEFIPEFYDFEEELITLYNSSLLEIKSWEESDNTELLDIKSNFKTLERNWDDRLQEFYNKSTIQFEIDTDTAGTIDFSNRKLNRKVLDRQWNRGVRKWNQIFNGRANTSYAICEDWRSDLEFTELKRSVLEIKKELASAFSVWMGSVLQDHFDPLQFYLEGLMEDLRKINKEQGSKNIKSLNLRIKKDLNEKLILPFTQLLSKQTLLNHINKTEFLIEQKIEGLSKEYAVVNSNEWNQLLSPRDFSSISGYELVSFEMAPSLTRSFAEVKNVLQTSLNSASLKINDLDEIISYTIETAETIADDDLEEAKHMVINGLERAIDRLSESRRDVSGMIEACINDRFTSIDNFAEELQQLTINENLNRIRFRISKAKALRRSGDLRLGIIGFLQAQWSKVRQYASGKLLVVSTRVSGWRKKIIPLDASDLQSRLLSDFIISSKKEIEKLPLIYKKLYEISALTDPFMFEGREAELDEINTAYIAWKEGKYAAVLVHGEKWGGLTTLINQLPNRVKLKEKFLHISVENKILDELSYFKAWSDWLAEDISDMDELVERLNGGPKRIIVLENIQHIYLRTLNGGICIKLLLKTVALTQKNIFWIQTVSTYAYQYLQRLHKLSGFYSYVVELQELSDEQIRNLITKRNRISGYEIIYESTEKEKADKKFQKLSVAEQQAYLEKQFYKAITDYARSNISMALNYWLLSTKSVDDKRLHIGMYIRPDDSFLAKISAEKLHILHALVLHDGLDLEKLATVLLQSYSHVEMLVLEMMEDGLIRLKEERIAIDPLVYRIIILLLKSKNLIY